MRRIGDLFKDLGFNIDASLDVKKAFVRHLVREADKTAPLQTFLQTPPTNSDSQLSFDAVVLGVVPTEPTPRKIKTR